MFALACIEPSKGGFAIIIENALSEFLVFAVALKVKFNVVSELTSVGSPLITPVEEFKVNPAPDKTEAVSEYETVSPSGSVAETVV
mgnify:CR=1 FL=1